MAAVVPLEKFNMAAIDAPKPPRAFGKARLAFIEPRMIVNTPALEQAWPIRPAGDDGAEKDKFQLECRLPDGPETSAFKAALEAFDVKIRALAKEDPRVPGDEAKKQRARQKEWFGLNDRDALYDDKDLKRMYTSAIKQGKQRADGTYYDDSVRFKITGWSGYVDEVLYQGEGDKKMPSDIKWRARIVDTANKNKPTDEETRFYICEGINMATGKKRMAEMAPCVDPAGNEIKDAQGNTVWEYVGPKHCQRGCKLTIVYQCSMVWLAGTKFGATMKAKQVFITPAPPKPKAMLEGIEIVDTVDPVQAAKAARAAMASDDLRDLDGGSEGMPDDYEAAPEAAPAAPEAPPAAGGKRPRDDDAPAAPEAGAGAAPEAAGSPKPKSSKPKKSKTVTTVDESF